MSRRVLVDTNVIIEAVRTVTVTGDDLSRLHEVHTVAAATQAAFKLTYEGADGLDEGEHDLLAFAQARSSEEWVLASPDKAAIRALVALGLGDRIVSLEEMVKTIGARARPPLREQFTSRWLVSFRSKVRLEGL